MRPERPLVGVTCDFLPVRADMKYTAYQRYVVALRSAGALAILLPPELPDVESHLALVDGLLFTGGDDLDPALWGGTAGPTYLASDPRRTEYETALTLGAIERATPLLGICLGAQTLNVACGGSLRCDLPSGAVRHLDPDAGIALRHDVDVMKGSVLAAAVGMPEGGRISVNTAHKNAPDGLGEKLRACGIAPDGLIEAIEHREHPFCLGVQWHPEVDAAADRASASLFRAFVGACALSRRRR